MQSSRTASAESFERCLASYKVCCNHGGSPDTKTSKRAKSVRQNTMYEGAAGGRRVVKRLKLRAWLRLLEGRVLALSVCQAIHWMLRRKAMTQSCIILKCLMADRHCGEIRERNFRLLYTQQNHANSASRQCISQLAQPTASTSEPFSKTSTRNGSGPPIRSLIRKGVGTHSH